MVHALSDLVATLEDRIRGAQTSLRHLDNHQMSAYEGGWADFWQLTRDGFAADLATLEARLAQLLYD